jgi:hypothetical protein
MEAGKNSVIYMGINPGPNRADEICVTTKVTGMMQRGLTVHKKNLGLCPASSTHIRSGVSNFVFYILTFYYYNTRIVMYVFYVKYVIFAEDSASAPKHVGIILCNVWL